MVIEGFITTTMLDNYLDEMVNKFFKILPMKESNEPSLYEYMSSLQVELIGCEGVIKALHEDARYLTLISILQYLIDNDCEVKVVKREVFKAISLCKKLRKKYSDTKEE